MNNYTNSVLIVVNKSITIRNEDGQGMYVCVLSRTEH